MNTTAYDVVIVTFNNAKIIAEVLRALYASRPAPHQVIVYDSDSTDDTCLVIKQQFPQVTLLEGEKITIGGLDENKLKKLNGLKFTFPALSMVEAKHIGRGATTCCR